MSKGAMIAGLRLGAALAIVTCLGFQAWADLTYGTFTWAQLPVYFTPIAAVAAIAALVASACAGETEPRWVALLRVNAATYAVITGVVYWAVLPHYGQPTFPWANAMIHGGTGVILVADWVLVGKRERLPWHTLWTVFAVPAVWLGYIAATERIGGRIPYEFLDPSRGAGRLTATVAMLIVAGVGVVSVLRLCTGLRVLPSAHEHAVASD
ncbi:Pr6Pr family membrane protein [Demequina sp.]|uniref:Pr6Pr family membrane protein n=1 Tax=Demequina sp. TaxID=2050685 RepID=UPI003D10CC25